MNLEIVKIVRFSPPHVSRFRWKVSHQPQKKKKKKMIKSILLLLSLSLSALAQKTPLMSIPLRIGNDDVKIDLYEGDNVRNVAVRFYFYFPTPRNTCGEKV